MRRELVTGPLISALSLDDVKSYGNVNHNNDDTRLSALLPVAINYVERYTAKALIDQTYDIYYDAYQVRGRMPLDSLNVSSIVSITTYDSDNNATVVDSGDYRLSGQKNCWAIFDNTYVISESRQIDAMSIQVIAGFGTVQTDIDDSIRAAMYMMVMHWYRYNGAISEGTTNNIPHNVKTMLMPWAPVWNFIG